MAHRRIMFSGAVGLLIMLGGNAVLAQTAPSEADISRALAPKSRGLPTLGNLPPAPPDPGYQSTATMPAPASSPPASKRRSAAVRQPVAARQAPPQPGNPPSVTLRTIQFKFGSAELTPDSVETLRNLGNAINQELKDQPHFTIEGHTDAYGPREYNDELSKDRAQAVKDYLVKQMGVVDERLQPVGKGSSEPVSVGNPFSGENRRVVVVNAQG
jgi:outer membrane protein OmpA-like peptidoglycan-associated protein